MDTLRKNVEPATENEIAMTSFFLQPSLSVFLKILLRKIASADQRD